MTEPTYEDYYPATPKSGLTAAEEAEYNAIYPGTFKHPDKPDALTLLNQASEAIADGRHYPKENNS